MTGRERVGSMVSNLGGHRAQRYTSVFFLALAWTAGCADDAAGPVGPDGGATGDSGPALMRDASTENATCTSDDDCAFGLSCIDGACVSMTGAPRDGGCWTSCRRKRDSWNSSVRLPTFRRFKNARSNC